jgi:hypothetical protein
LILLEESWAELFLLWAIQYSVSLDNHCEDEKLIKDVLDIFKQLKLDPIEFDCLKAIVLFRFGRTNEDSFSLLIISFLQILEH